MLLAEQYYRQTERAGHAVQPMRHGLGQCEFHPGMATVPEALTLTNWTAEQAAEFIRYRRDPSQPFFMWLSFHKPHPPFDPPEPYYSMYRHCDLGEPAIGDWCDDANLPPAIRRVFRKQSLELMPPEIAREARAAYYGLVTQIDYNIGRVYQALYDEGLDANTLILFTSDHGDYLGDHRSWGKLTPHEGSAHLPLVIRLPPAWGEERVGLASDALVTHADILPTLVRAAGCEPPSWSDGYDLLPVVRGETSSVRTHLESYMYENAYWFKDYGQPDYVGITDGQWKYIWYPEGGREHLFDLAADPHELRNLVASPERQMQLQQLRNELIARQTRRGLSSVRNGELVAIAEIPIDVRLARAQCHYGLHGERWNGRGQPCGDILH